MKTNPSVWLACALLGSGCVGFGRPPQYGAGIPPASLGTPVSPTRVTPGTDSTRADRPAIPTPAEEPPPGAEQTAPSDAVRPEDLPETDAPRWRPLEAPPEDGPSALLVPAVVLGPSGPFPLVSTQRARGPLPVSQAEAPASSSSSRTPVQTGSSGGWQDEFLSTGRRSMQTLRLGSGEPRVMIVGSIYGNEPESVLLLDQLERNRNSIAPLAGSLLVVRTANPDGFAEHMRTNQRGVDLNRNFPSVHFTANPNRQTGPHPASEVETQVLVNLLRGYQPQRVVHVRSAAGSRPLVLGNAAVWNKTGSRQLPDGIDWGRFNGSFKAGSLEEYVSQRMSAEMVTILLPPQGFETLAPGGLIDIAFMNAAEDARRADDRPAHGSAHAGTAEPSAAVMEAAAPGAPEDGETEWVAGEHGYVELLPPPPPASDDTPAAARYYELPPPE